MRRPVNAFDYAGDILHALKKGVLLTTASGKEVNTMTIGWAQIGMEWYKPVFTVYVRESRHTKKLLEESGEFTVNIPVGECDSKILGFCGSRSGRDINKIQELGLHLEEGESVSAPGIRELPLTLECKIIYKQDQSLDAILPEHLERFYPEDAAGKRDGHTVYYGEILSAYVIE